MMPPDLRQRKGDGGRLVAAGKTVPQSYFLNAARMIAITTSCSSGVPAVAFATPSPLAVRWRREETAMQAVTLSEMAVAVLRLHVEGERMPANERNLPAYQELVEAGIMEPVPGLERVYRLTANGRKHRDSIVERETERIERGASILRTRATYREPPGNCFDS